MAEGEIADIYADGINLASGPYGVTLVLHRSDPPNTAEGPGPIVGRVRISTELAAALGQILLVAVEAEKKRRDEAQ